MSRTRRTPTEPQGGGASGDEFRFVTDYTRRARETKEPDIILASELLAMAASMTGIETGDRKSPKLRVKHDQLDSGEDVFELDMSRKGLDPTFSRFRIVASSEWRLTFYMDTKYDVTPDGNEHRDWRAVDRRSINSDRYQVTPQVFAEQLFSQFGRTGGMRFGHMRITGIKGPDGKSRIAFTDGKSFYPNASGLDLSDIGKLRTVVEIINYALPSPGRSSSEQLEFDRQHLHMANRREAIRLILLGNNQELKRISDSAVGIPPVGEKLAKTESIGLILGLAKRSENRRQYEGTRSKPAGMLFIPNPKERARLIKYTNEALARDSERVASGGKAHKNLSSWEKEAIKLSADLSKIKGGAARILKIDADGRQHSSGGSNIARYDIEMHGLKPTTILKLDVGNVLEGEHRGRRAVILIDSDGRCIGLAAAVKDPNDKSKITYIRIDPKSHNTTVGAIFENGANFSFNGFDRTEVFKESLGFDRARGLEGDTPPRVRSFMPVEKPHILGRFIDNGGIFDDEDRLPSYIVPRGRIRQSLIAPPVEVMPPPPMEHAPAPQDSVAVTPPPAPIPRQSAMVQVQPPPVVDRTPTNTQVPVPTPPPVVAHQEPPVQAPLTTPAVGQSVGEYSTSVALTVESNAREQSRHTAREAPLVVNSSYSELDSSTHTATASLSASRSYSLSSYSHSSAQHRGNFSPPPPIRGAGIELETDSSHSYYYYTYDSSHSTSKPAVTNTSPPGPTLLGGLEQVTMSWTDDSYHAARSTRRLPRRSEGSDSGRSGH